MDDKLSLGQIVSDLTILKSQQNSSQNPIEPKATPPPNANQEAQNFVSVSRHLLSQSAKLDTIGSEAFQLHQKASAVLDVLSKHENI